MGRDVCYYDGRCGFCRGTTRWLHRLDWLHRLEIRDMHAADAVELPVPIERAMEGMPMRTGNGRVLIGLPAVRRALRMTPIGFLPAIVLYLPGISLVARYVYGYVANHRPRDVCSPSDSGGFAHRS